MIGPQVISPLFVGREEELAVLTELLERALEGQGSVAVVGGDVGIGKSRLCRELKARAVGLGARVIEGRCSPSETTVPFAPFLDALRFRLRRGEGAEAARVLKPVLAHVAPFFRELEAQAGRGLTPTALPTPFEPILRVVRLLAETSPIVLLIEDVHWADPTSRDLLLYLARRIRNERVLLLITVRTDELPASHPVQRLIATMSRERVARPIDLRPLNPHEVAGVVAGITGMLPAQEFVEALWQRTEGNPLFVEELMSVLALEHPDRFPELRPTDLAQISIPATIQDAVRERIEPLGDEALEALALAAVIGRSFRFEVLAAALGWPEAKLLPVVESLVEHRLLEEEDVDRFQFRHGLVQEVLYSGAIGRRRRIWHRAVADALARCAEPAEMPHHAISYHARQGGDFGRARHHAILAAEQAERLCAWRDAEALYEEALHALEQDPDPPRGLEPDLLERMAEASWWQSRLTASLQYLHEALALRRELGDRVATARVLRRMAELDVSQHQGVERALRLHAEAESMLHGGEASGESALLANDGGRLRLEVGDPAGAEESFGRGLAIAHEIGECHEEAVSMVGLGVAAIVRGEIGVGVARLDVALDLVCEHVLPLMRASAVYGLGVRALEAARETERARQWLESALDYARRLEAPAEEAVYLAYGAALDRRAGAIERALAAAEDATSRLRQAGRREYGEALRVLGDIHRVRGDHVAARSAFEEAIRLGYGAARVSLARLDLAEQEPVRAAGALEEALARRRPDERLFRILTLPYLVEARVRSGALAGARHALAELRAATELSDYRAGAASAAWSEALVLRAEGRWPDAEAALRVAGASYGRLSLPYEQACALLELAEVRIEGGGATDEVALEPAHEALELFQRMGAARDVDRARDVLRRAGVRVWRHAALPNAIPGGLADDPLSVLTARERDVLRELARGLTNKHIARVLHIRPKTVANHVSSVLAKLGCATRTEAARTYLSMQGGVEV